jgi:hypothetical protein
MPEPVAQPAASAKTRGLIVLILTLATLLVAALMLFLLMRPPGKATAAQLKAADEAVQETMQALRDSNWLNFEGTTRDDLTRRLILLDKAIAATDAYATTVGRMDPKSPAFEEARIRRDAYVSRGTVLKAGRRTLQFLSDHFGHWQYFPAEMRVKWDEEALIEQFGALQSELQGGVIKFKAGATQAATVPTTLPIPTRLPEPTTGTPPAAPSAP